MATSAQRELLQTLGAHVRDRRKALGLTQVELAERLGWSQERISVLENGKYGMPSLPLLARLAEALEVSLGGLLETVGYSAGDPSLRGAITQPHETLDARGPVEQALHYTLQRLLAVEAVDLRDALNQTSDQMAQAMGADKVDAFMYDPATASLVAAGTSNTPMGRRQHQAGLDRLPVANRGRTVEVFESGKCYYTGHADQDPEVVVGLVQTLGIRSMFLVPLRVGEEIRGVLSAASAQPDRFSREEQAFFESAARWIAMVARRAELSEMVTRQSVEQARRLAAEELVTTLAHDLGNQLTPLRGRIDVLLRRLRRQGNARDLEDVAAASEALQRMQQLIENLLDIARLEGGVFSLSFQPTDLVAVSREIAESLRQMRDTIEVRAPDELVVEADPVRIGQALHNLVHNAIQHTPDGTPILITLEVEPRENEGWATLVVHDDGPGIAPEALPTLFQRYGAGPRSSGLGLGLFVARGILEAHGGSLTVESAVGEGTTFRAALPLCGKQGT